MVLISTINLKFGKSISVAGISAGKGGKSWFTSAACVKGGKKIEVKWRENLAPYKSECTV